MLISLKTNRTQVKKELMKKNLTRKMMIVSCPQYFRVAGLCACATVDSSSKAPEKIKRDKTKTEKSHEQQTQKKKEILYLKLKYSQGKGKKLPKINNFFSFDFFSKKRKMF